jgi:hypothetical protein
MPCAAELLQELLVPGFAFIFELAGCDAFGGAPVGLGDEVLDVGGPDAPDAPFILSQFWLCGSCV